jgi:phosphatidylglycerophosphate synthase
VILALLETAAFAMMVLEVLTVMWLAAEHITVAGALAVETFTRMASMASAFIPGNLGALEASNIAVAGAVHVTGGAVALALVRRVRGLAWCAIGFLLYPRTTPAVSETAPTAADSDRTLVSLQDLDSDRMLAERLGGVAIAERLARAAVRAGYSRLVVWTPANRHIEWRAAAGRIGNRLRVIATSDPDVWRGLWIGTEAEAAVTLLAPGIIASPDVLLAARTIAVDDRRALAEVPAADGGLPTGVFRCAAARVFEPNSVARDSMGAMARNRRPVAGAPLSSVRVATHADLAAAEHLLRQSIYKPTDGVLGRFNRRLSIPVSIALLRATRLSPHVMSVFVGVLGLYAGWLFSSGTYTAGVMAAVLSWAAGVLDGCDGELARLQFKDSAFGCWVDTLGDYVYYLAVFIGLTIGAVRQTGSAAFWWCGGALLIGVLLTFTLLILLRWRATGGRPDQLRSRTQAHFDAAGRAWTRLLRFLAPCATRAMMPYGLLLFAALDILPAVVVLAAIGAQIYWISLAREYRRLIADARRPPVSMEDGALAH